MRMPKKSATIASALAVLWMLGATSAAYAMTITLEPKPNPPDAGDNQITVVVKDDQGKPVDAAKVSAVVSMPAMGTMPYMEEKVVVAEKDPGQFVLTYDLAMGGTWDVVLTAEVAGKKDVFRYSLTTGIPGLADKNSGRSSGADTNGAPLLDIGPQRLQRIGVRFAEAKVMPLVREIQAVGVVEQDKTHREEVTLRFSGYLVRQFKGRVGDQVIAGEPLFSVYSPDLVTAQSEFLLADKLAGSDALHKAASERLINLGLSPREIESIRKTGKPVRDITIRAPMPGTILEISAREGAAVSQGQVVYVIGDLSKTYIVARVFQQDIGDLKAGQAVKVKLPTTGTEPVEGRIDLVYPQVEQGAGTGNVRIEADPVAAALRPGNYVDVRLPVDMGSALAIPTEAVLYSGQHAYVFVDREAGALEPREIVTGRTAGDYVEVVTGLKAGERVAASGTFLLGSEAQLRSALPKWNAKRPMDAQHDGHQP